jgi:hypothetical protein
MPGIQAFDRRAFERQFDVGVTRVDVGATRVSHERHAYFPQDAQFQQPRIEAMAQIVKSHVTDPGPPDRRLPGGLDCRDRSVAVGKHDVTVAGTVV